MAYCTNFKINLQILHFSKNCKFYCGILFEFLMFTTFNTAGLNNISHSILLEDTELCRQKPFVLQNIIYIQFDASYLLT